jgi:cytosine/creatinine deaminase
MASVTAEAMLEIAVQEASQSFDEGGLPIGAALYCTDGTLLGSGHNRLLQRGDPSIHAETDAFRSAGRRRSYRDTVMVTTLAPCWYCSGLIRHFGIGQVLIGDCRTFYGGTDWLREHGVDVIDMQSAECERMINRFIDRYPEIWKEASCSSDDG